MSIKRKIVLMLVKVPFVRYFVIIPVLFYLIRKLRIDLVGVISRDESVYDFINILVTKLRDNEKLLSYKKLNICRHLVSEGIISEADLVAIESMIKVEESLALLSIETSKLFSEGRKSRDKKMGKVVEDSYNLLENVKMLKEQALMPWQTDTEFFEKHPQFKKEFEEIINFKEEIGWYFLLMKSTSLM